MRGELFMSGNCNFRCFFCLREEIGARLTRSSYERLDEWIALLHEHGITGVTVSSFNAEPTIQREFLSLVSRLADEGFDLELRTNGAFDYDDAELIAALNRFETVWLSVQSLTSDTLYAISHVRQVPDFVRLAELLIEPELRASVVVNRFNAPELMAMLASLEALPVTVTQVRRPYEERLNKLDEDTAAFDEVLPSLKALPVIAESHFEEHQLGRMRVSIWRDVLMEETGLKYFPATEQITDVGRIIPPLRAELA
ncbi:MULTISPECIES: radical SAM protein [unclassified Microbacterium]|uniref:radical SAM protein n=1 Tax=unclassified Microbacterium TaxID=2609290 RepID=UPI002882E9F0|nr:MULTISPECIES: radical SAM protein [unclassified Microbacterium]